MRRGGTTRILTPAAVVNLRGHDDVLSSGLRGRTLSLLLRRLLAVAAGPQRARLPLRPFLLLVPLHDVRLHALSMQIAAHADKSLQP
jgi:hypothetical protein